MRPIRAGNAAFVAYYARLQRPSGAAVLAADAREEEEIMQHLERTEPMDIAPATDQAAPGNAGIGAAQAELRGRAGWDTGAVAGDIATVGVGTGLCLLFNTVLIFLVPRVLGVADYGYWRLFLLYASYAGLLHLGLADGALLAWAGKPLRAFSEQFSAVVRFLVWENLAVILLLCAAVEFTLPRSLRFIGIAVAGFSVVYNLVTLLQFRLQAARLFRPVAISTAAPLGFLLAFLLIRERISGPGYRELIICYIGGWLLTLAWLAHSTSWRRDNRQSCTVLGRAFISAGWPVLLANSTFAIVQRLDRFAMSWVGNITNFAEYSLAASVVAVPLSVVQAIYKVLFPHLAAAGRARQERIYRVASRLLLLGWIFLLPYYFALEAFVGAFLPQYFSSLPVARILLVGVLFLAQVQVLHMSFSYLHGRQREFFYRALVVLPFGLGLTTLAAFVVHSSLAVAWAEVLTLGLWWLLNEWQMQDLTGHAPSDWGKFLATGCLAALCYHLAGDYGGGPLISAVLYLGSSSLLALAVFRTEIQMCTRLVIERYISAV